MARVTAIQHEAAYAIAAQVYSGHISTNDGARELHENYGLNETFARDFIYDFRCMRDGKVFHRGMSTDALQYFLASIKKDYGDAALAAALNSANAHVDYMKEKQNAPSIKLRGVIDNLAQTLNTPANAASIQKDLDAQIEKSLSDTSNSRKARLDSAAKLPRKASAVTQVYLRNPDVVAEVLVRAHGTCEGCRKPAPFKRRSDGSPYLEVHHRKQLAHGGEDTVANAIALCPNCHRYQHHGAAN